MNNEQPANNDFLIAEYTLGLLDLQETAKAHALLGQNQDAVITALKWEDHFLHLVDQLPPIEPPPHVLRGIQSTLGQSMAIAKAPRVRAAGFKKLLTTAWSDIRLWRASSAALAAITLAMIGMPGSPTGPEENIPATKTPATQAPAPQAPALQLAILQAPGQTSTPGWVLTVDPQRNLLLNPMVHIDVPAEASVQLWTHNDSDAEPRSLGIIDPNQPVTVPAELAGDIGPSQIFEMTLEAKGGAPAGNPKGAVLFIGRTVIIK